MRQQKVRRWTSPWKKKNGLIEARLKKSKANLNTINFAKADIKAKISSLQTEGQMKLKKMKEELGKMREESAKMETAMIAKISNRKLIEKALHGAKAQAEDMQERLVAGRIDKLRKNNTQMSDDLDQIRKGLQKSQVKTAQAEQQRTALLAQAAQLRALAKNKTAQAQQIAREALAKVVAIKQEDDAYAQKAQKATMVAQASMLTKCSVIWDQEHPKVKSKLKNCKQVATDLKALKASVKSLETTVKAR